MGGYGNRKGNWKTGTLKGSRMKESRVTPVGRNGEGVKSRRKVMGQPPGHLLDLIQEAQLSTQANAQVSTIHSGT